MSRYFVSVTGLRLKGPLSTPRFWWHAIRSMTQARQADGNLMAEARTKDGVHHTLSVWESEAAMKRFLYRGAHRQAIKAFPAIATGETIGYEADAIPGWDEALAVWRRKGRAYTAPNDAHRPALNTNEASD